MSSTLSLRCEPCRLNLVRNVGRDDLRADVAEAVGYGVARRSRGATCRGPEESEHIRPDPVVRTALQVGTDDGGQTVSLLRIPHILGTQIHRLEA